jgi:hypothetical protein
VPYTSSSVVKALGYVRVAITTITADQNPGLEPILALWNVASLQAHTLYTSPVQTIHLFRHNISMLFPFGTCATITQLVLSTLRDLKRRDLLRSYVAAVALTFISSLLTREQALPMYRGDAFVINITKIIQMDRSRREMCAWRVFRMPGMDDLGVFCGGDHHHHQKLMHHQPLDSSTPSTRTRACIHDSRIRNTQQRHFCGFNL